MAKRKNRVWPFRVMRLGETVEYDVSVRSHERVLLRGALHKTKKALGFKFRVEAPGKHMKITRIE